MIIYNFDDAFLFLYAHKRLHYIVKSCFIVFPPNQLQQFLFVSLLYRHALTYSNASSDSIIKYILNNNNMCIIRSFYWIWSYNMIQYKRDVIKILTKTHNFTMNNWFNWVMRRPYWFIILTSSSLHPFHSSSYPLS